MQYEIRPEGLAFSEPAGLIGEDMPPVKEYNPFRFISELPRTKIGKVDFRKLEEMAQSS